MAILNVGPGMKYSKIGDAVNASSANDTVRILSGTYHEDEIAVRTPGLTLVGDGQVFIDGRAGVGGINNGYPSGQLQYAGSTGKSFVWGKLLNVLADDVTLRNITVKRSMGRGIAVGEKGRVTKRPSLYNVKVDTTRNAGLVVTDAVGAIIRDTEVSGAADIISGTATAKNHAGGFTLRGCLDTEISGCSIHHNWGEGFMVDTNWGESSGWFVKDTDIYNNGWVNVYIHATENGVMQNCRVWESPDFNPDENLRIGAGLGVHLKPIENQSLDKGGRVYTNRILLDGVHIENAGLIFGRQSNDIPLNDVAFVNSNIVNPKNFAVIANGTHNSCSFTNNVVILGDKPFTKSVATYSKINSDFNVYSKFPGAGIMSSGDSVETNPELHNVTGASGETQPPVELPPPTGELLDVSVVLGYTVDGWTGTTTFMVSTEDPEGLRQQIEETLETKWQAPKTVSSLTVEWEE